jgi:uncharacterized protein YdiU (UPF0061 family)
LQLPDSWTEEYALSQVLFAQDSPLSKQAVAQKYGGHQFGQWNPLLGDGRGLLLAEVIDQQGRKIDLHLKGAGQTPWSRHADGRAVLRSTIREYLASEYMHALGIPTSRALALFTTDEPVYREHQERAAMLIRTAPSHLRFGHFEYYHHTDDHANLDALFAYAFKYYFVAEAKAEQPHLAMLASIVAATAKMIANWQVMGFNHGVMNTDNMSVHGITFDYGPYAFFDHFDPHFVCNRSDHKGRYRFSAQPSIGLWNLNALGQAFRRYASVAAITEVLDRYEGIFLDTYHQLLCARLAMADTPEAREIANEFMTLLQQPARDYHLSFRALAECQNWQAIRQLRDDYADPVRFTQWVDKYQAHVGPTPFLEFSIQLAEANPAIVLRNHHAQTVIAAAEQGDFSLFDSYLAALNNPFSPSAEQRQWASPPPADSAAVPLSCSS